MHGSLMIRIGGVSFFVATLLSTSLRAQQPAAQDPLHTPGEAAAKKMIDLSKARRGDAAQEAESFRVVMGRCTNDWSAYRFHTKNGETWRPNIDADRNWVWQKIVDDEQPPFGEYDVQAVYLQDDKGKGERVVRMERKTGRSWRLGSGKWIEYAEQPDFADGAKPKNGYRLMISASSMFWNEFRFNEETGETWTAPATHGIWEKISETKPPPAGRYVLQAVFSIGLQGSAHVIRLDPQTGKTWMYLDDGWVPFAEANGFADLPAPKRGYRLTLHAAEGSWNAYRHDPDAGWTWVPQAVGNSAVWKWIPDRANLPKRDYDLSVVHWLENGETKSSVFRMDRYSGQLWACWDDRSWDDIDEQKDFKNRPVPDEYALVTDSSDLDWYAVRVNPENGDTWCLNRDGDNWQAQRWVDRVPLLKSEYEVGMVAYVDGGSATENVYRMDLRSGKAQVYTGNWQALGSDLPKEPLSSEHRYQMYLCRLPSGCRPFRFDPKTGTAWSPTPEQPMTWSKMTCDDAVPDGVYVLNAVAWLGDESVTYLEALRTSTGTGRSWYMQGLKWLPIAEPYDVSNK